MKRICDGNHGKLGMGGCSEPFFRDGKWLCAAKLAKPLIEDEQAFLDAYWEAGVSWKDGDA